LDVTEQGTPETLNLVAFDLKARVLRETGLVVTIGGGISKTVAKVASQVAKPNGLLLVKPGEEATFLNPLSIDLLPGVGPKSGAVLKERGIKTMGDLATCDEEWLARNFGRRGPELKERAVGVDRSLVSTHRETKSISAETTMAEDVEDEAVLLERMEGLAKRVARQVKGTGLLARTVSIKLRLADFRTFTRQITLPVPTNDAEEIYAVSLRLLRRELEPGRKFRLVGIGVANLGDSFQLPLFPLE